MLTGIGPDPAPIYTGLILALVGTALATSLYGLIVAAEQFQDTRRLRTAGWGCSARPAGT